MKIITQPVGNAILVLVGLFLTVPNLSFAATKPSQRAEYLRKQMKLQEKELEKLKEENLVLKSQSIELEEALTAEKTNRSASKIYSQVLRHYKARDIVRLTKAQRTLIRNHAQSVYADNALFLVGRLHLVQGSFARSIQYFDLVLKQYPTSNKRVAATLFKGVAYRKLKLWEPAILQFEKVKKVYPGSPESFKAEMELKLTRFQSKS